MKMITMLVSALALAACGGAPEAPESMAAPSSSSSSASSAEVADGAGSPDDAGSPAASSSSSSAMSAPTSSDDDAGETVEAAAVVIDAGAPPSYTPDAACHDLACEGNVGPPSDASPYVTTCLNQADGCDGCVNLSTTGCTSSGGTIAGTDVPVYSCPIGTVCYPGTLNRGGAGNTVSCTFTNICPM